MNFYILAGGQSRRLGQNKALVELNGQTVIEKVISAIPTRKEDIKIVTSTFQTFHFLKIKMIFRYPPRFGAHRWGPCRSG